MLPRTPSPLPARTSRRGALEVSDTGVAAVQGRREQEAEQRFIRSAQGPRCRARSAARSARLGRQASLDIRAPSLRGAFPASGVSECLQMSKHAQTIQREARGREAGMARHRRERQGARPRREPDRHPPQGQAQADLHARRWTPVTTSSSSTRQGEGHRQEGDDKLYYRHPRAGFPGALKTTNLAKLRARHPEDIDHQRRPPHAPPQRAGPADDDQAQGLRRRAAPPRRAEARRARRHGGAEEHADARPRTGTTPPAAARSPTARVWVKAGNGDDRRQRPSAWTSTSVARPRR